MKDLKFWMFILNQLQQKVEVMFLCVLESEGSSPGRQGFKMAVTKNHLFGSIGGGMMEHKFVEMSRHFLQGNDTMPFIKRQIHLKEVYANRSGMICSGEQTILLYPIQEKDIDAINTMVELIQQNKNGTFISTKNGFQVEPSNENSFSQESIISNEFEWYYKESFGYKYRLSIVGGGHVSLAFSKLMRDLGFYILLYDNRNGLNTIEQNNYAHEIHIIDYDLITNYIPEIENNFVVIMTFGYRTDKQVVQHLIKKNYQYLGMLGSKSKTNIIKNELAEEGFTTAEINRLHAPVGLLIKSQTPEEIAVSIAAEIILKKNSYLS